MKVQSFSGFCTFFLRERKKNLKFVSEQQPMCSIWGNRIMNACIEKAKMINWLSEKNEKQKWGYKKR